MGEDEFDIYEYREPTQEERDYALTVYPEIYPGVHGNVVVRNDGKHSVTFINVLWAKNEGSGQVGKYLDSLSGAVIVDWVISPRLEGMLERRGFVHNSVGKGMRRGI